MNYIFKEGIRGVGRNASMVIALVITAAISLALVGAGILTGKVTEDTKAMYLDQVEVMVQLDDESAADEVREALEDTGGVDSVEFFSQQDSYDRFVELFEFSDPELVEEVSPDAFPPALHVQLTDPTDTEPLAAIEDHESVGQIVNQNDDVASITDSLDSIRNATLVVAIALSIAALLLIGNMVVLSAANRREEMSLMRTIGASRSMVNGPFVVEAVISVLLGAVVGTAVALLGHQFVLTPLLTEMYASQIISPIHTQDVAIVMVVVSIVGVILSAVAATITLRIQEKRASV